MTNRTKRAADRVMPTPLWTQELIKATREVWMNGDTPCLLAEHAGWMAVHAVVGTALTDYQVATIKRMGII